MSLATLDRPVGLAAPLDLVASRAAEVAGPVVSGRVARVIGLNLEVEGLQAAIGDGITVHTANGKLPAEVVALRDGGLICMPLGDLHGVAIGDRVRARGQALTIRVGAGLLGRVLDGLGRPIDDGPALSARGAEYEEVTVDGTPPHPLRDRKSVV